MPCCRYSGQWSAYLATMIWASNPGAGMPRSIGRERRRQLDHPRAVAAGELGPHMPDHLEVARHEVEQLGDVLAELAHRAAAVRDKCSSPARARSSRAAGGGEGARHTPQRQHALAPAAPGSTRSGSGGVVAGRWLRQCRRALQIVERELQLRQRRIESLGRNARSASASVAQSRPSTWRSTRRDRASNTLQRFDVIRQRSGRC